MSPVLKLQNVWKSYRSREPGERGFLLKVPELSLTPSSVNVFVGESGCGKSTLLDVLGLISTADHADAFSLETGDGNILQVKKASEAKLSFWRSKYVGYVLQNGGLLRFMKVKDHVYFRMNLAGRGMTRDQLDSMVQKLHISSQWNKWPHELSIGQRQRVAIALSLAYFPSLVLADEPTGALDPCTAREIAHLLVENARESGAVTIVVSHDRSLFSEFADRAFTFDVEERENEILSVVKEISIEELRNGHFR